MMDVDVLYRGPSGHLSQAEEATIAELQLFKSTIYNHGRMIIT